MRSCSILCLVLVWGGIFAAQDTNFSSGPQYLVTSGSPLFARSIATPTLSLSETSLSETPLSNNPAPPTAASPTELPTSLAAQNQVDLTRVYWGVPEINEISQNSGVIEITASEPPRNLPASIIDVGVEQTTDAQELRGRGVGVTVGEAASFWKKHKVAAAHLYTNRDIERLHGG